MSTGGNIGKVAQDPASLRGKILRLRDDGTVPPDNPFVGRAGYRPEIYTLGHRNTLGLIVHPETGRPVEQRERAQRRRRDQHHPAGPQLRMAGRQLRARLSGPARLRTSHAGGHGVAARRRGCRRSRSPAWPSTPATASRRGRATSSSARCARAKSLAPATCERIVFNAKTEEMRRESMLSELRQRIREVRQGPDGLLYLLTDERRRRAAADRTVCRRSRAVVVGRQPLRIVQSTIACITAFSKSRLSWALTPAGSAECRRAAPCDRPRSACRTRRPSRSCRPTCRRLAAIGSIDHFDRQAEAHAAAAPSG